MGEIIALIAATCFGLYSVLVKYGAKTKTDVNGAFLPVMLTFILSLLIWLVWRNYQGEAIDYWNPAGIFWFILGGVFTTYLGWVCVYSSIERIGSVRTSNMLKLNPFFVVFLAIVFINESLTLTLFLGMSMIAVGVLISVRQSMRLSTHHANMEVGATADTAVNDFNSVSRFREWGIDFIRSGAYYGLLTALCYAIGNIFRKKGMFEIADPFFGSTVGSLFVVIIFSLYAIYRPSYRRSFVLTFTRFNAILFSAGLCLSLGQILLFLSIHYIELSRASLIITLDTFFTLAISTWLFKTYENISLMTIVSVVLSVAGAIVVILA